MSRKDHEAGSPTKPGVVRPAPSVRTYALLLLGIGVIVLISLGWHMQGRLHAIEETLMEEGNAAARLEFERALENTFAQVAGLGEQIASWDEVRQQLASSTYYTYWRDNRVTAQGLWPVYVRGVELYDAQGVLLSNYRARLPERLPDGVESMLVVSPEGNLCMVRFVDVVAPGDELGEPLGYIGLRVDLLSALRSQHRFTYIDSETLALSPGANGVHPAKDAAGLITYEARRSAWGSILPDLMRQTLVQFMFVFIVLVALHYLLVTRLFTRPLRKLRDELEGLRAGTQPLMAEEEPLPVRELSEVRKALHDYRRSLELAHDELDRTNAQLWAEAHVDALTGAYNRRAFDEDWARLQLCDSEEPLALMLIDCDFFKSINDSYGHETGDRVLQEIARLVIGELRRDDRLYRLGGDEFLAILWGAREKQAMQVAERCRAAVGAHPVQLLGMHERLRVSIGVVASEHPCAVFPDLLRQVDMAMYHAKRGVGEQKVVLFKEELDSGVGECSNRVVNAVLDAVDSGHGISMHYQPVVHAGSGRIAYYEALLRIRDDGSLIMPDKILAVTARRGLETRLDLAVLRSVSADLESGVIPMGSGVAINFNGETIADAEVAEAIHSLAPFVASYKIVLEITETTLISRFEYMNSALSQFRALGFRVALDDFGSGYSSLRYLARMPVDIIKLDRSLIEAYGQDEALRGVVVHVIDMLHGGGFDVVAEGIETEAQRHDFEKLGVGYLQGWAFGRPLRPAKQ